MLPTEGKTGEEVRRRDITLQYLTSTEKIIKIPSFRSQQSGYMLWFGSRHIFLFPSSALGKYQYGLECRSCTLET
jgi:hypothetical protein